MSWVERISLSGGGANRQEAIQSIDKQLAQWADGATWDYESLSIHPRVHAADGSVRIWRVEAELTRHQDS
jgi:hypothetical protein